MSPIPNIAVFFTTAAYGLPHIDFFLDHNPNVPIHIICSGKLDGAEKKTAWRNCDIKMAEWWWGQGQFLEFDYAIFIEWDVVFASTLSAIFPGAEDFYCKRVRKPGDQWNWFAEVNRLPEALRGNATGAIPMAVIRLSRKCLASIFSHPEARNLYAQDIISELRLGTLASACGFEPKEAPGTLPHVDWFPTKVKGSQGVWHAVKNRLERPRG